MPILMEILYRITDVPSFDRKTVNNLTFFFYQIANSTYKKFVFKLNEKQYYFY